MGNSELIKKGGIAVEYINNILISDLISRKIEKVNQINIFELDKEVEASIKKESI